MSERKKLSKSIAVFLMLGLAYYIFIKITGISIPCPVNFITGGRILCPGCGITAMCLNILIGNFHRAFMANPCIFILAIIWSVIFILKLTIQPQCLKNNAKIFRAFVWLTLVALIVFGIVRNIIRYI